MLIFLLKQEHTQCHLFLSNRNCTLFLQHIETGSKPQSTSNNINFNFQIFSSFKTLSCISFPLSSFYVPLHPQYSTFKTTAANYLINASRRAIHISTSRAIVRQKRHQNFYPRTRKIPPTPLATTTLRPDLNDKLTHSPPDFTESGVNWIGASASLVCCAIVNERTNAMMIMRAICL